MKRILNFAMPVTVLAVLCVVTPVAAHDGPDLLSKSQKCSNATLRGSYSATITGTLAGAPFTELDLVSSTGNGTFAGTGTVSMDGTISTTSFTATYTVNPDCSGSASLSTGVTQNFNIKLDGSEVMFIATTPGATITGDAKQIIAPPVSND